jgi:enoyl-CoA hydratase/carnithine racemase
VVGAALFDAETAERYGWVNRALPAAELDAFVDDLARAIASRAPGVVRAAKKAIDAMRPNLAAALDLNNQLLGETFSKPRAAELTRAALAAGAQTRAGEKRLEALLRNLGSEAPPDQR